MEGVSLFGSWFNRQEEWEALEGYRDMNKTRFMQSITLQRLNLRMDFFRLDPYSNH